MTSVASLTGSVGFNDYPARYNYRHVMRFVPKTEPKRRRVERILTCGVGAADGYQIFVDEINALRASKHIWGRDRAFVWCMSKFAVRRGQQGIWMTDRQWVYFNSLRYKVRSLEREEACSWTAEL